MKSEPEPHSPLGVQHRMLQTGDLLDDRGLLLEAGYATAPLKRYDQRTAALSRGVPTQWHSYAVFNQASAFLITVGNRGRTQYESVMLVDFAQKTGQADLRTTADFPDLPLTAGAGVIRAKGKLHEYTLRTEQGRHHLYGHAYDSFGGKDPLLFDLIVEETPQDRLVLALPDSDRGQGFVYSQQLGALPVEGRCIYGASEYRFAPATSYACFQWGRAVLPRRYVWRRAQLAGTAEGSRVALFLGDSPVDSQMATENALLCDGRLHKLGPVQWEPDPAAAKGGAAVAHTLTEQQGRLRLRFEPAVEVSLQGGSFLAPISKHCLLGHFSGTLRLDDGRVLNSDGLQGMLETVRFGR